MELVEDMVWCEVHGGIHKKSMFPYILSGIPTEPPECTPQEWRNVWVGGRNPANLHIEEIKWIDLDAKPKRQQRKEVKRKKPKRRRR